MMKKHRRTFELLVDGFIQNLFHLVVLYKQIEAVLKRHYGEMNVWNYESTSVNFTSLSQSKWANRGSNRKGTRDFKTTRRTSRTSVESCSNSRSRGQLLKTHRLDRVVDVYIKQLRKTIVGLYRDR